MPGLLAWLIAAPAVAQLRIVDYNTGGGPREGISTIFEAIGVESVNGIAKAPDVVTLQELQSSASTTQAIVDLLNAAQADARSMSSADLVPGRFWELLVHGGCVAQNTGIGRRLVREPANRAAG